MEQDLGDLSHRRTSHEVFLCLSDWPAWSSAFCPSWSSPLRPRGVGVRGWKLLVALRIEG